MKKFLIICTAIALTGCGAIGIGSNHKTNVYNNSNDTINVKSNTGVYKIKPESSMVISSFDDMTITSKNKSCSEIVIVREPNTSAMILDVFPGFFLGIVPILIDAISNDLYRMPETYSYSCIN